LKLSSSKSLNEVLVLSNPTLPELWIFVAANPNGIQIHQPRVGGPRRTGEERLPWETVPQNSRPERGIYAASMTDSRQTLENFERSVYANAEAA
jgi:hypothetical protein